MKKLLLILVSLVQGSAAQGPVQPIRLKEAIADFPRSQLQLKNQRSCFHRGKPGSTCGI
jgi:hypothetical protein